MASMAAVLERFKEDPLQAIQADLVEATCRQQGYQWRERKLSPAVTIGLFIQQILQANACCQTVRHLARQEFTGAAWCQARARLPLAVYQSLLAKVCPSRPSYRWRGHRTFYVDGTGFSLWDTPELRKLFGLPANVRAGCGFPVGHLLVLFEAGTGLLQQAIPAPAQRGDLADVPALLEHLGAGDVLIGDEAFGGYVVLALLRARGAHGLFPLPHNRIVDFTPHRPWSREGRADGPPGVPHSRWLQSLGWQDQRVEYYKPLHRPAWLPADLWEQLPASIPVRELRRTVPHPECGPRTLTMVTTLTEPKNYPARALTELRGTRWQVETDLADLKTTMKMDTLHCRTPAGVAKELCVFALVYNLVRQVMREAARRQQVPPRRISFADALHWLQFVRPGDPLPRLVINPVRPYRIEPRVKKRRDKEFPYMTRPRAVCRRRAIQRARARRSHSLT